jgi:hypothetical protein
MSNYNNVNRVLIGDGNNDGSTAHISGIEKGDLFFLDEKGNIITTAAGGSEDLSKFEKVQIAVGIDTGEAILSSPIQGNTVSKYESTTYVAPTEMVTFLGYNGNAGTGIAVTQGEEYRLRVLIKDDQRFNGQRMTLSDSNYEAPTNDAIDTISPIICLFTQTDYGHNYYADKVCVEKIADATGAAVLGGVDVVAGSDLITVPTGLVTSVGTGLRVGGSDVKLPVFIVEEIVSVNEGGSGVDVFKVDQAYTGPTASAVATDAFDATVGSIEWGIKLIGKPQVSYINRGENEPVDQYEWINFEGAFTSADDLASTQYVAIETVDTKADPGQGYWKQVADAEEAAKGYLGDTSKRRFHDKRIDSNTEVGVGYDSIIITHADIHGGDFQDTYRAPLKTEIYIPTGGTGQGSPTDFVGVMNGFFATVLGFEPAVF